MTVPPLRIQSLDTRIMEHPLRKERIVVSHAGRHDRSRYLLVTVRNADGVPGYGEAATVPIWSGETAESAQCIVRDVLGPRIIGATFANPFELQGAMDSVCVGSPFARSAVDTAAWDMWARSQNKRVLDLITDRLGPKPPPQSILTRASIGDYEVDRTVELATAFWKEGIRVLKLKTGCDVKRDVARIRAIRNALGKKPVLTVDYNGAFSRDTVRAGDAIDAMARLDVAMVEQPMHRHNLVGMAELREKISVPLMIDEGVFTPHEFLDAYDLDAADIYSVYPGKMGGFGQAIVIADALRKLGLQCAVGSNLESDIGQAAMATLAAAIDTAGPQPFGHDLGSSLFYQRSSVTQPLKLQNGRLRVPTGPGFGVEPSLTLSSHAR
jgi:muconate cycloisomerase